MTTLRTHTSRVVLLLRSTNHRLSTTTTQRAMVRSVGGGRIFPQVLEQSPSLKYPDTNKLWRIWPIIDAVRKWRDSKCVTIVSTECVEVRDRIDPAIMSQSQSSTSNNREGRPKQLKNANPVSQEKAAPRGSARITSYNIRSTQENSTAAHHWTGRLVR